MKNKFKILLILISMLGLMLPLAGCIAASPGRSSSADWPLGPSCKSGYFIHQSGHGSGAAHDW